MRWEVCFVPKADIRTYSLKSAAGESRDVQVQRCMSYYEENRGGGFTSDLSILVSDFFVLFLDFLLHLLGQLFADFLFFLDMFPAHSGD
jgi:hypothetical protein